MLASFGGKYHSLQLHHITFPLLLYRDYSHIYQFALSGFFFFLAIPAHIHLDPDITPRAVFLEVFFAHSRPHEFCLQSIPLTYPAVTMLFILWLSFITTNIY